MKQIFLRISEFLEIEYNGFYLIDKQGKKISCRLAKNLLLVENENGLTLKGQILSHSFRIFFTVTSKC